MSDPFDTYVEYLALKRHFTSDYDYVKYNGKVRVSRTSFDKRRDKYFFYKLSKKPDYKTFILANMIYDNDLWIGDLLDNVKAEENYENWVKRQESITYIFKTELGKLDEDFNSNLIVEDGQYPKLLRLYMMKSLGLETIVILNDLVGFLPYWNKNISDPICYPNINRLVLKTKPFIQFDRTKMKDLVSTQFAKQS